jgi:hypothetical protein
VTLYGQHLAEYALGDRVTVLGRAGTVTGIDHWRGTLSVAWDEPRTYADSAHAETVAVFTANNVLYHVRKETLP